MCDRCPQCKKKTDTSIEVADIIGYEISVCNECGNSFFTTEQMLAAVKVHHEFYEKRDNYGGKNES